jgi:hypothetical protein
MPPIYAPTFFPKSFGKSVGGLIPNRRQGGDSLGLAPGMPCGPAARMQPGAAGRFDAMGEQRIARLIAATAG